MSSSQEKPGPRFRLFVLVFVLFVLFFNPSPSPFLFFFLSWRWRGFGAVWGGCLSGLLASLIVIAFFHSLFALVLSFTRTNYGDLRTVLTDSF